MNTKDINVNPSNVAYQGRKERIKKVLVLTDAERAELPFRRISALAFVVIMLIFGLPLWWQTTSTYRMPFRTFSVGQQITLPVYISIASSYSSMKSHVSRATALLMNSLSELPEIGRVRLIFKVNHEDMDEWKTISRANTEKSNLFGIYVAIINESAWPYSGYTSYFGNLWTFILNSEDESKLAQRMHSAIADVLLDISYLSVIVRRDLKQHMQLQEVAALSSSQQKRLIWDSVAPSACYIVQVIFLHAGYNESSENYSVKNVVLNARRFARKLAEVSDLIISSEHLWDFDLTAWLKKDVQERNTIQMSDISQIVTAIEQETSTVESSAPVMKLVVLDAPQPLILLDHMGDESDGIVVASWGALLSHGGHKRLAVNQSVIAAMRVLFGLDTDLAASANRLPLPIADWEIRRIKLRSVIDCSVNAISSVAAIHKLISQIDNIVINEEIASKTNLAVELVSGALLTLEKTGHIEVVSVVEGRALAESVLNDKSLLSLLYFPNDQKFAVYLPLFLPTLLPLFGSILALNRYWMGKE
uniref:GPI transamidase component PIG-S n=1 Tax=Setaria digitata TaxID=48799 RepID=A0A915PX87_9BILA